MSFSETPLERCLADQTDIVLTLKFKGAAALLSGMAFLTTISLSFSSCRAINNTGTVYSNRRRRILLAYITYMSLICVASFIVNVCNFLSISASIIGSIVIIQNILIVLALWGADGFMIWRCFMLYYDVHKVRRTLLRCLLSILALASLAPGVGLLMLISDSGLATEVLTLISIVTNCILACLIVGRVLYYQRSIQEICGTAQGSFYSRAVALCVESCAIIIIFETSFLVVSFVKLQGTVGIIFGALLPDAFIFSALLLIHRVAVGKDVQVDHSTLQMIQFHRSEVRTV